MNFWRHCAAAEHRLEIFFTQGYWYKKIVSKNRKYCLNLF